MINTNKTVKKVFEEMSEIGKNTQKSITDISLKIRDGTTAFPISSIPDRFVIYEEQDSKCFCPESQKNNSCKVLFPSN